MQSKSFSPHGPRSIGGAPYNNGPTPTAGSPQRKAMSTSATAMTSPTKARPQPSHVHTKSISNGMEAINLNSSTNSRNQVTGEGLLKKAFLLDVVVERDDDGKMPAFAEDILRTLGSPLTTSEYALNSSEASSSALPLPFGHRRGASTPTNDFQDSNKEGPRTPTRPPSASGNGRGDRNKLEGLVREIQETEQRYLKRITTLKNSYADPLRRFAKRQETMIIPLYDAKVMFANIDAIVLAAEAFCQDLLMVDLTGRVRDRGIGDVCLRHLKEFGTFDCYRAYYDKQDESQRSFQSMIRRESFQTFTESVKYQTAGIGNIGIRELLAEPVQRVPRYTLLWQGMIDCLSAHDQQRAKLQECIDLASNIAKCETDERTKRATVMYCLERTVDGFPANLISNNRDFIDCIDVDDFPSEWAAHRPLSPTAHNTSLPPSLNSSTSALTSPTTSGGTLNCTLFLFDDKVVIAKRQNAGISGRKTTGLDDINSMLKAGGGLIGLAQSGTQLTKDKLSFKGVFDLLDVSAIDIGEGEFQLVFDKPPTDQSDKWNGRALRNYTVVHPPAPPNFDASAARRDKQKFVRNIWAAQALHRTKISASAPKGSAHAQGVGLPKAYKADMQHKFEDRGKLNEGVMLYANVWTRNSWLGSLRKSKAVLQITAESGSEPLPLGEHANPTVVFRVDHQHGGICGFSVMTSQAGEIERENDVVHVDDIAEQVVELAHAGGILRQRPHSMSQPVTPTSHRMRSSMMNLDSISRNLFGSQSMSSRSKSTVSRSSTIDTSRFSVETKSTQATSVELDDFKALPGIPLSVGDDGRSGLRITPRKQVPPLTSHVGENSEMELDARLDLARQNSISATQKLPSISDDYVNVSQEISMNTSPPRGVLKIRNTTPSPPKKHHLDAKIPEVEFKPAINLPVVRPLDLSRRRTPSPGPQLPAESVHQELGDTRADDYATVSSTQRPIPPRSPSPSKLLGPRPPNPRNDRPIAPPGTSRTVRVVSGGGRRISTGRETAPLKESSEVSPSILPYKRMHSEENFSPRKRSFDRNDIPDIAKVASDVAEPSEVNKYEEDQLPVEHLANPLPDLMVIDPTPPVIASDVFWEDPHEPADYVSKAVLDARRLKSELERLSSTVGKDMASRQRQRNLDEPSPGMIRSPPSRRLSKQLSEGEFEKRRELSSAARRTPIPNTPTASSAFKSDVDVAFMQGWTNNSMGVLERMMDNLLRAETERRTLVEEKETFREQSLSSSLEINSLQGRLNRATAKSEVMKGQIFDFQSELETVYEAFNVELDGMFNDAQLPQDQAFLALTERLIQAKNDKNDMHLENLRLKRELQEANMKKDELGRLLRTHASLSFEP